MASDQGVQHSVGLLSMMGNAELMSMFTTRKAVNASRRKEATSVAGGDHSLPSVGDREEASAAGGG